MDSITNPFIFSGIYAGEEYFCDRKEETKELCSNILNWRNTVLISPRRMGKSGLIEHTFHQPEIQRHFLTFNIDIMNANSSEELAFTLSNGLPLKVSKLCPHLTMEEQVVIHKILNKAAKSAHIHCAKY